MSGVERLRWKRVNSNFLMVQLSKQSIFRKYLSHMYLQRCTAQEGWLHPHLVVQYNNNTLNWLDKVVIALLVCMYKKTSTSTVIYNFQDVTFHNNGLTLIELYFMHHVNI